MNHTRNLIKQNNIYVYTINKKTERKHERVHNKKKLRDN